MWNEVEDNVDMMGPSRIDDKLLEVVGVYSSLHVGRIQVSMADPVRLGQAREVKVRVWLYDGICILYNLGGGGYTI